MRTIMDIAKDMFNGEYFYTPYDYWLLSDREKDEVDNLVTLWLNVEIRNERYERGYC